MTKRFAALSVLTVSWLIIGGLHPEPSQYANAVVSTASAFGQQPATAASNVTWEYRILYSNASHLATLEGSINKLTEQGYTVETFQPVSLISGGSTEVFVLLRRMRR